MYHHPGPGQGHPYAPPQPQPQPQPQHQQPHQLQHQQPPPPYHQHGYPQVSSPTAQAPYQPYPYSQLQQHPYSPLNHSLPTSPPPELSWPNSGAPYYQQQQQQHQHQHLPSPTSPYYSQHSPMSLPLASSSIVSTGISLPTTPTTTTSFPISLPHSPVAMSVPIMYKAEMTDGQLQGRRNQQDHQSIKVEYPPSSSSSQTSIPVHAMPQRPTQDAHAAGIQRRQSQLLAMQEHSRPNSVYGSWNQSSIPTNINVPIQSPIHGTYPAQSQPPGMPPYPTRVELQSSLTDNTPIVSNAFTLDPASSGVNRVSRPYGSSHSSHPAPATHAYPSAIEVQSSLTEIDATIARPLSTSGQRPGPAPYAGAGSGSNFGGHPASFQNHGHQHQDPSAIEAQSSLTEIDATIARPLSASGSRPGPRPGPHPVPYAGAGSGSNHGGQTSHTHPASFQNHGRQHQDYAGHPSAVEAQSSLTEIDNLPFPLEAQSPLTVIDDLSHSLEKQSALTEVDNLPYSLSEQSALTEVDNLPHALSEQSSLTVLDDPKSLSSQLGRTPVKDSTHVEDSTKAKGKTTGSLQTLPTETTKTTDTPSLTTSVNVSTSRSPSTIPSAVDTALAGTAATPFSMSNWTMPSDFLELGLADVPLAKNPLSPTGSLHRRAPATMYIDTSITDDDLTTAQLEKESASILIPLTPAVAEVTPGVDSPQEKSLSASSSLSRKPVSSNPPTPAPKPVSLMANKTNHPQSGSSGATLTSEEIRLETLPPDTPAADGGILQNTNEDVRMENKDEDDDGNLDKVDDDGMSAFIRELQSSMSLSRSGSGSNSMAGLTIHKGIDNVKRTDSSSSKTSQKAKSIGASLEPPQATTSSTHPRDGVQAGELQQLEATQFEWTFTETEQAAYERIFSLWERPAEERVSSDIAGKVYMTLGLTNHDLFSIWKLLNPEEKPALTRTQFIAGLHLVNCKLIGYELPADLPDELMMSAAAVGRAAIPPRPVQGPSAILSNYVESVVREAPPIPIRQGQSLMKNASLDADPMCMYNISFPSYNSIVQAFPEPNQAFPEPNQDPSGIYKAYPHQPSQPPPVPDPMQDQFLPQYYFPEKTVQHGDGGAPIAYPVPSSSLSKPMPAPALPARPSKPGPHALHGFPADAPVIVPEIIDRPALNERAKPLGTLSDEQSMSSHSGTGFLDRAPSPVPPTTAVSSTTPATHSVDNPDLYASPPDAWDHDAAPPELDVDGSYIKYRSDMTLSASVTANHPINPKSGVFYFEITIDHFKGNAISLGISSKSLRKNCQVGWDLNSWGYHSDKGFLYFGNGNQSIQYSYEFNEEDVVGCGVNFLDRAVFFTLNGHMLGVAFRFIKDTIPLYPAVGLSHAGTVINANFGDQTFLFNIHDYKKTLMSRPPKTQPVITWSGGAKNDKLFKILNDNLTVVAKGDDEGCIRGPKVSPRDRDVFYFEITILHMPPTDVGTIMIGICGKDQNMKEILGWKANSFAYSCECGDYLSVSSNRSSLNARSQSGKMKARARGVPFCAGSVVGCGVDFASRELFFTLNGPRPSYSGGPGGSGDEPVAYEFKANFGQVPFMFDLPAFEASGGQ